MFIFFLLLIIGSHLCNPYQIFVNNDPGLTCVPYTCDGTISNPFPSLKTANDYLINNISKGNDPNTSISIQFMLIISPKTNQYYPINVADFVNSSSIDFFNFSSTPTLMLISLQSYYVTNCAISSGSCPQASISILQNEFKFAVNQEISFLDLIIVIGCNETLGLFSFPGADSSRLSSILPERNLIIENCSIIGNINISIMYFIYATSFTQLVLFNCSFQNINSSSDFIRVNSFLNNSNSTTMTPIILIQSCSFLNIILNNNASNLFYFFDSSIPFKSTFQYLNFSLTDNNGSVLWSVSNNEINLVNISITSQAALNPNVLTFVKGQNISIINSSFSAKTALVLSFQNNINLNLNNCSFNGGVVNFSLISNNTVIITNTLFSSFIDSSIFQGLQFNKLVFMNVTFSLSDFNTATNNDSSIDRVFLGTNFVFLQNINIFLLTHSKYNLSSFNIFPSSSFPYNGIVVYSLNIFDLNKTFQNYSFQNSSGNASFQNYSENSLTFYSENSCFENSSHEKCVSNINICDGSSYITSDGLCVPCTQYFLTSKCNKCITSNNLQTICLSIDSSDNGLNSETIAAIVIPSILVPLAIGVVFGILFYKQKKSLRKESIDDSSRLPFEKNLH